MDWILAYLWAQRVVVINARLLVCVDTGALELEKSLHRDVHEGEGGNGNSVGASNVSGSRGEPRCNCRINPVRLPYRQTV